MKKVALGLAVLVALADSAYADKPKVTVWVRNCTDRTRVFDVYNGDDAAVATPRDQKQIKKGMLDSLKCRGGGTDRCKVGVHGQGNVVHVKDDDYAIYCEGSQPPVEKSTDDTCKRVCGDD